MEKILTVPNSAITYTLQVSLRAKRVSIVVRKGGNVFVTIPKRVRESHAVEFVEEKKDWIIKKVNEAHAVKSVPIQEISPREYEKYKVETLSLVKEKINTFNAVYGFTYGDIRIKKQATLWGSCSRKGNLNFNYKVALLPEKLLEYIVVHELCHLKEFNHGKGFWALVEKTIPDYKECRSSLKMLSRIL